MRAPALAAVMLLAAACDRGPEEGFEAKAEGAVEVELEGTATYCMQGRGTLYTLTDATREGRVLLARLSRDAPVAGTTLPVLTAEAALAEGAGAMSAAPVAFTGPNAFRLAPVDSGKVTFEAVEEGRHRGRFRLFLSYPPAGSATLTGSFAATGGGECPEES